MAVPYGRKSRSKSRQRRAANMKFTTVQHTNCAHCGEPKMAHFACGSCGAYGTRQVREVVEV
jgi:large subunit ribosomal protein L32